MRIKQSINPPPGDLLPSFPDLIPLSGGDHPDLYRDNLEPDIRLLFEQFISHLSLTLINSVGEGVDREVIMALEQVRELFRCDLCSLITVDRDRGEVALSHTSNGVGILPVPESLDQNVAFPWMKSKLLRGEPVVFTSLDELPAEASIDRLTWQKLGIQANVTLPIQVAGCVRYGLVASHLRSVRRMGQDQLRRLRLVGEVIANALIRCKSDVVQLESRLEVQDLQKKLLADPENVRSEPFPSHGHDEIVGQSQVIARTLALTEQVAPTDSTVLIYGETGTGKELIAQDIHRLSRRRSKQMVKVNCASLPAALVESELFGRERGAYTGALTRQAGRFELADGGTIFLDEIAEMSLELQAKLLRVLQEGQFERLGGTKTIQVNVRVITATNRNLSEEVKKGTFREDLFYRLNVFQIVVPPLRERVEDIPLLAWSFVNEFADKMGKRFNKISKQDMAALQGYQWPGNVRELRNVIEHAAIVSTGETLQIRVPEKNSQESPGIRTLEEYEIMHIREALRLTGGRIKGERGAARLLGLNPSTLYSRMQKLGISKHSVKDDMSS